MSPTGTLRRRGRRPLTSRSMVRDALRTVVAAAVLSGALAVLSAASAGAVSFSPCGEAAAASAGFTCATVPVALDRSGTLPGTLSLSLERRLAGAVPSRDAVLALAGGPGQAAVPLAPFIAQAIAPALNSRDLLVFDQRGTGKSDPLSCPALAGAASRTNGNGSQLIEACARELGPARGDYTTIESVADIEAVRQAGGYEKLVLYGTSYGTKVALEYAARYPQNVESLLLDSTETPAGPEAFHVSTFKAMAPALRELCRARACAGVRNPVADLATLDRRLATRPLRGIAYSAGARPVKLSLTRGDVYGLLLAGDLNPALRASIPAAVHAAIDNDPAPLLRLAVLSGVAPAGTEESSEVDLTLFVDTSCEETPFPWQRTASEPTRIVEAETALNALPGSDFYPFDPEVALLDQTIPLCLPWPDASPPPPTQTVLPDVPTLILSGAQDLRTPTENARNVAKLIPDAQLLAVPYAGHSVIGADFTGCAKSALGAFFAGIRVSPCPVTADPFPPAPTPPRSIGAINPAHGGAGASGRTLAATVETIRDLRRSIVLVGIDFGGVPVGARFGGLRGGSVRVGKAGAVLDRLSYIPGVQLSGVMSSDLLLKGRGATANLAISGGSAAKGHLLISSGGRIAGALAGRRVALTVSSTARGARARGPGRETDWPASSASSPLPALARIP
jgi:pimeloyl-ACP methyl ester carboxylesterase